MEIAALTSFLAPFLARLLDNAGDAVEGAAWEHAKRLWGRLRDKVAERAGAAEAAEDAAAAPDDPRTLGALELQLEKLLAADAALAADVAKLWEDAKAAGVVAAGERSVAVGGDVSGSAIVTGDQNTVDR